MGWFGFEILMVEMGWVGFSYQNLYIFRYYNYQTAIYPYSMNSFKVPPVRRFVLLIYLSGFTVRSSWYVHFCSSKISTNFNKFW